MPMKTTIDIDDRLFERARVEAARRGVTLKALVHDALQSLLSPRPKGQKGYALDLPVVRGRRPPSVDVADRRALYDVMDDR